MYGMRTSGMVTQFEVFGLSAKVQEVSKLIHEWVMSAHEKSTEAAAWAKKRACDLERQDISERRNHEALKREIFKGRVPDDTRAMFKTTVKWDGRLQEKNISPKDVFGTDLSALNEIRMRDEVYIRPIDMYTLEILGDSENLVETAELHLTNMILKARMHHFGASQPVHILLDESEGLAVCLRACESWWPFSITHRLVPFLVPDLSARPGDFRKDELHDSQISLIRENLKLSLAGIRFEKAHFLLSIRFGCLAMARTQQPGTVAGSRLRSLPDTAEKHEFGKDEFVRIVNDKVDCEAKSWAWSNEEGETVLARMKTAHHLLQPAGFLESSGYVAEHLGEIRPMIRGIWVFKEPSTARIPAGRPNTAPAPSMIMVQIDWVVDELGKYEKSTAVYYKLKGARPIEHMDLKLLELSVGKAWQFSLLSMANMDRRVVPPVIDDFARRVQVDKSFDHRDTLRPVRIDNGLFGRNSKLQLQFSRLERVYQFGIKKTDYQVELYSMWYPGERAPCWGLNVTHQAWVDHLAELESLGLGEEASWGEDAVPVFFPDDGRPSSLGADAVRQKRSKNKDNKTGSEKKRARNQAYAEHWGLKRPESKTQKASPSDHDAANSDLGSVPASSEEGSRDGIVLLTRTLMELSKVIHGTGNASDFDMPAIKPEIPEPDIEYDLMS